VVALDGSTDATSEEGGPLAATDWSDVIRLPRCVVRRECRIGRSFQDPPRFICGFCAMKISFAQTGWSGKPARELLRSAASRWAILGLCAPSRSLYNDAE
jgi:hypothetical protein